MEVHMEVDMDKEVSEVVHPDQVQSLKVEIRTVQDLLSQEVKFITHNQLPTHNINNNP